MAGDVSIKDLELLALNYLGTVPKRKTERAVAVEALKVTTMGRYAYVMIFHSMHHVTEINILAILSYASIL